MPRLPLLVSLACMVLTCPAQEPAGQPAHRPGAWRAGSKVPATDRLLVCNKAEHTLSIFSPAERRELAVVETGPGPHEVAVSPDGRIAVVSDYGEQQPGHSLTIVDVVAATVLRTVDLAQSSGSPTDPSDGDKKYLRPHGVQFVAERRVVVTSETSRCLLLVDIERGIVERTWSTGQPTMHMVSVTSNGRRAFATSVKDGTVVSFDLTGERGAVPSSLAAGQPTPTGSGAEGLAVHPITGDAWVANRAANTLSVFDGKTNAVTATIDTGAVPFRVAFTPGGKLSLVTCAESGELQLFDGSTQQLVREVSMHGDRSEQSAMPLGVACDHDGRLAYVTCGRGEFVAIVDLAAGEMLGRMAARKGPDGIAYARPSDPTVSR